MPAETPYTPQLGPARPSALPQASPADFGAGVGAGIAQLGGALHESEIKAYRLQRGLTADQERAEFAKKLAGIHLTLDKAQSDDKLQSPEGHTDRMTAAYKAATDGLTDGITEDSVRREAQGQLAELQSTFVGSAYDNEVVGRAKKTGTDAGEAQDRWSALVRTSSDPKAYPNAQTAWGQFAASLENVPPELRQKITKDGYAALAIADAQHTTDTNPNATLIKIDSGTYNDVLDGAQIDRLRSEAEAAKTANAARARAEAEHGKAIEKDQLAALGTTLDSGAGTYGDRVALRDRYAATGDQSKAAEWAGKAEAFKATAGSASWTLPQLDRRITELQGKQTNGGLTPIESFEMKGLVDRRSATASNLNQSGGALLQLTVATGKPLAPLVPGDQQSMRARSATAIAAAARYGRPQVEPLLQSELSGLKDMMSNGTGGKQEVLSVLAGFGDPRTIVGAAQQLGGQDDAFVMAARALTYPAGQQIARDILAGQDAMKTRGAKWDEQLAQTDFGKWYGLSLRDAGPDYRRNVFEGAKALYAARRGDTPYNPGYFADAVESVMGRSRSGPTVRGGVAHVGGLTAPGGWVVIAPPTMAPDEMMRRFARGATYDYAKASGGTAPVWADGHPFKRSELNMMVPRLLANGRYGFINPRTGGLIHDNRGQEYSVDLDLLPGLVRRGK